MSENTMTNGLTEAALRAFVRQDLDFEKKKKALSDAHKAMRAKVKTFGVDLQDFDAAKKELKASDGGALFINKLQSRHRLMKMLGLEVARYFAAGDQFKLPLEEPEEKGKVSKAYRAGAAAYLNMQEESDIPHGINTAEGQDWLEGFRTSEAFCKKGLQDIKLLDAGEDPDNPKAAKGTLAARTAKPAEAFNGSKTPQAGSGEDGKSGKKKPKKTAPPKKQQDGAPRARKTKASAAAVS